MRGGEYAFAGMINSRVSFFWTLSMVCKLDLWNIALRFGDKHQLSFFRKTQQCQNLRIITVSFGKFLKITDKFWTFENVSSKVMSCRYAQLAKAILSRSVCFYLFFPPAVHKREAKKSGLSTQNTQRNTVFIPKHMRILETIKMHLCTFFHAWRQCSSWANLGNKHKLVTPLIYSHGPG